MLFTTTTKALLGKVRNACIVSPKKATLRISGCIHIYADNDCKEVGLYTTDLDNYLHQEIESDITESGETLVNAKQLLDALKGLNGRNVTLMLNKEDGNLSLRSDMTTVKLETFDAADYPSMPKWNGDLICGLRNEQLRKIIDRAAFAAHEYDQVHSILGGIDINVVAGRLNVCATDGSRLTWIEDSPMLSSADNRALIPAHVFNIVDKCYDWKKNTSVSIVRNEDKSYATIQWAGGHLTARIIPGEYPRYTELFPEKQPIVMAFKRAELLSAAKSFCAQKQRTNVIKFTCNTMAYMKSSDADVSLEMTISVDGNHMIVLNPPDVEKEETSFVFALNCHYLRDICESDKSEYVRFKASSPLKPFVFSYDDGIGKHLLMPVPAK